eukprot:3694755-Pyramimonas_sp.AAC.1
MVPAGAAGVGARSQEGLLVPRLEAREHACPARRQRVPGGLRAEHCNQQLQGRPRVLHLRHGAE